MFRFPLREVLQAQDLEELMRAFISSARMGIALVDARGEILSRPRPAPLSPFCRLVRSRAEGKKRCALSYRKAARAAALMWEPYLFRSTAGCSPGLFPSGWTARPGLPWCAVRPSC